ncbi:MAG: hypothetical protein BJBARM5_0285 [Candidatus Parvarchaeum acidophilus ARMAN-5]|jgi:hypothetical protein|uniref:Uncharacterized protein n=1 Tax=Candidatus Parvarchaeum acidophilus ARMAN-5 TaxID=662762 RepID=D6GUY5_PARA5|nr:MAG: hypothetical protein BJBARM5_0285 [Candidatus Parvarchaeum acidophilus ARMAN-5]
MEEYEVIEHVKKDENASNNIFLIVAINYIIPTYVKFESEQDFKAGEKVSIDNNAVFYKNSKVGEVKIFKSAADIEVDTNYDIKYTGGYSVDGKKVYLDKNFPKFIDVDGKKIDTIESIAKHHEMSEKWMIDDAYEYAYAHEVATKIEREYVESIGVNWDAYCKEVNKNLHAVYNTKADDTPSDLDLSPYFYSKDEKALKEIRETKE